MNRRSPLSQVGKNRRIAGLLLSLLIVTLVATTLPQEAKAFPGEAMAAAIFTEIKNQLRFIYTNAKTAIEKAQKTQYSIAFKNGLRVFLGKVAEDTAVWISSAGTGQKPLFITNPHYWRDLSNAAAGDFLDTVSKDVFGTSLCEPLDVNKKISIELGVRNLVNPLNFCENACNSAYQTATEALSPIKAQVDLFNQKQAEANAFSLCPINSLLGTGQDDYQLTNRECFSQLQSIYNSRLQIATSERDKCLKDCNQGRRKAACTATQVWSNVRDIENLSIEIQTYFEPEQNDIGQILTLYNLAQTKSAEEVAAQRTVYEDNTGSITSKLGTDILTPNFLVKKKAEQAVEDSTTVEKTQTGSLLADTIGVFTNTLTQRLMDRFFKSKCGLNPSACSGPSSTASRLGELLFGSNAPTGIAAARLQFASLARIDYKTGDPGRSQIDVADRLVTQGIINSGFRQAIDEKLTLREAIERGLIDPNSTFGFDESDAEAEQGIPYRSITYLRKYRVVPVGWELAALHIREVDQRAYGIKELMDLYEFCGQDALHGIPDPLDPNVILASPFCGLVDPGWVLKAPQTYCRRQGVGDEIISRQFVCDQDTNGDGQLNCSLTDIGGGDLGSWIVTRNQETCVDEPSCVKEDAQGNCIAYGYCYEERPSWRFGGDECPGYYASCKTYTNSGGTSVNYLASTIDSGTCNAENAGCRGYCPSTGYNAIDQTYNCSVGTNLDYFDRDAERCPAGAEGCTELIRTANGSNVLANGSFEYYTGTIDDGGSDSFGFCSSNGAACSTNAECAARCVDGACSDTGQVCAVDNECGLTPYICEGWRREGGANAQAVTNSNSGVGSPNLVNLELAANGGTIEHTVDPGQPLSGLTVTFSYYAKSLAGACSGSFGIRSSDNLASVTSDVPPDYTDSWQRFAFTTTLPELTYSKPTLDAFIGNECAIAVDGAKVEFNGALTVYTDYQTVNELSLKIPQTTILSNGDFAEDDGKDFFSYPAPIDDDNAIKGDGVPDGWTDAGGAKIEAQGYNDALSVNLRTVDSDRVYTAQVVPIEYGKTYEVSGWVKTALTPGGGVPFGSILTECVYGTQHPQAYETYFPDADEPSSCLLANYEAYLKPSSLAHDGQYAIEGQHDWTPVRFTLTANNPDIGFLRVACINKSDNASGLNNAGAGIGDVWCDDVRVTESAVSCAQEEVGCQTYRPVGPGSTVNGVVRNSDLCPANQVGCKQFREMPIERIPNRPAVDPVHFIETSGEQCTAADVGCEEYTNLDEAAAGGEAKEYYSRIRQCVKEDNPNAGNFYTWEGSEESGFQLRAYKLLKSDVANYAGETGQAPCTNLSVGSTTVDPVCEDGATTPATCTAADMATNPDCTEFYGEDANVYYRLRSRVVMASAECRPYRNTIDSQAGNDTMYTILASESTTCRPAAANCRQYKGTTAGGSRTVYADAFEEGSVNGWTGGVGYSNESVNAGGHSLRTTDAVVASKDLSTSVSNGSFYSLNLWMKARTAGQLQFQIRDELGSVALAPIADVTTDWAQYSFGPVYVNFQNNPTQFFIELVGAGGWVDNLELIESVDSAYRIKGTTASCDAAYAGCSLYTDRANQQVTTTGFSTLCSSRAVGCEAFTVTQNSDNPFASVVRTSPFFKVSSDRTMSYVNSTANRCSAEQQSCTRFALPTYNESNLPISWNETYLLNDPDRYGTILCNPDEEWCEEYTEQITDSRTYFRDPGSRTCEYRTGAAYAGKLVDGWFITGTNTPCPSVGMTCSGGSEAGALCSTAEQQRACLDGGGSCIAYPADGETKEVNLFCASTCTQGGNVGKSCFTNTECSNVCIGGDNDGNSCLKDEDCGGGACSFGLCGDGSARPLCDGRRTGQAGGNNGDQDTCLDEGGLCAPLPAIGKPGNTCQGGPLDGTVCRTDNDCCSGGECGTCSTNWVGVCTTGYAGCTEYRDPLDPAQSPTNPLGCNVDCTYATDKIGNPMSLGAECQPNPLDDGRPGCQPYYLLRQSLASQVAACNSQIDFEIGCQPFYDTENPTANFIGG